jgi:hypothetical protein
MTMYEERRVTKFKKRTVNIAQWHSQAIFHGSSENAKTELHEFVFYVSLGFPNENNDQCCGIVC